MFFGESTSAFFSYKDVSTQRKLILPVYPKPYYDLLGDPKIKYQKKKLGEIRLLGIDVATQGGSKNDATAISLLQMMPTNYGYSRSATYMETIDGGHGQDQAIRIRQLYDDLDCDFVVIDCNGRDAAYHSDVVLVKCGINTGTLKWESEWKLVS